jgi:carbonic anhydrase
MIPAREALQRLREGNRRFVSDASQLDSRASARRCDALVEGQRPFAVVLGCSDSRVPAEIVFDQGLGDLFVIRVAGNVVAPSQIGSVEFAAERLGARLVVVLGHTGCGAVAATLEALRHAGGEASPGLRAIVDRIRPALADLPGAGDEAALLREGVRANVRASVDRLRRGSEIVEQLVREQGLVVVGAEYALETGEVTFLDVASEREEGA